MNNTQNLNQIIRQSSFDALGNTTNALSWKDAMRQAGLDWTVSKLQHLSPVTGEPVNSFGIYRDDTAAFLGQVGHTYTPVQNIEQFQFVDALLENIDGSHYVSAGSLSGGEKVFCVAQVGSFDIAAPGDAHKAYLVFSDYKNSKGSCRAQLSLLRQVCANGMHTSVADSALTFRHTTNIKTRMAAASKSIGMINRTFDALRDKLETLSKREITSRRTVENILDRLFPETPAEREGRANYTRRETQALVAELFAENDGDMFPSQSKTPYALFNAVTNYVDHHQTPKVTRAKSAMTEAERRAENAIFGSGSSFKENALEIILEQTAHCPTKSRVYSFSPQIRSDTGESILDTILDNFGSN